MSLKSIVRLTFVLFLTLGVFSSCVMTSSIEKYKEYGVFFDPSHTWINKSDSSGFRSLTLKVVNTRYVDAWIKVTCSYKGGTKSFVAKDNFFVKARSTRVLTVSSVRSALSCKLERL